MLSVDDALRIARESFPNGPEKLVEILNPVVQRRPLGGCDGMCLARGDDAVIFLNESLGRNELRFTLAHELAHLLLGIPPLAGESLSDMLGSDSAEEKRVNSLAASLLLPQEIVKSFVSEVPVVAGVLKRLARKAQVSELCTVIRVATLAEELELISARVVHFDESGVKWQWSLASRISDEIALSLLKDARDAQPKAFRVNRKDGTTVVASMIEQSHFRTSILFVQVLPAHIASPVTSDERRGELERLLFLQDSSLRPKVNGLIGAHNKRIADMLPEEAIALFWELNVTTLAGTAFDSKEGREYVEIRIRQLC
jgi:Zn-dependent peptidase ImmA (M78 family)